MSEHLKLDCLLIEPIAEPDSILLGVTLNPAISLVNINGKAHSPNSVVHQILLVAAVAHPVGCHQGNIYLLFDNWLPDTVIYIILKPSQFTKMLKIS